MTPRKKRLRYKASAIRLAKIYDLELNPDSWEEIWALLDEYEEPTFLYAISDKTAAAIKFGRSVNPGQRLKALKTGNPSVELLAFCPSESPLTEKEVHSRLRESHVYGEWFSESEEARAVVQEMWRAAALWESAYYVCGRI